MDHLLYQYITAGPVLRIDGCIVHDSCRGTGLNEHCKNVQFVNKKPKFRPEICVCIEEWQAHGLHACPGVTWADMLFLPG